MTNRQRFIAGCINPYYENFATKEEVKLAKNLAKGRYWDDPDYGKYCSYTPSGIRSFFDYDDDIKLRARNAARLWAKGKQKRAKTVYNTENSSKPESKFRVLYIEDCDGEYIKTVAEIGPCGGYSVIGNGESFELEDIKKDWGENARWGKYIKLP